MGCACCNSNSMLMAGYGQRVINPAKGISLAGYFNPRPNVGVMDDLHVRALLFKQGDRVSGLISYDLILLSDRLIELIRQGLGKSGYEFAAGIPLCATHTHTGPDVGGIFDLSPRNEDYLQFVAQQTVQAVKSAIDDLAPAQVRYGSVEENPFAFNRRYWMKDGTVVTNPGLGNPDIVRPEGPVDREIGVLVAERNGKPVCLVANICNHTDATSGDLVSADWPGHLERAVQEKLGLPVPVIALIAPAGNVNHFDVNRSDQPIYDLENVKRIGRGYGDIVLRAMEKATPLSGGNMVASTSKVTIAKRSFTREQLDNARRKAAARDGASSGNLTSEDLAKGSGVIEQFFAQQLLAYVEQMPETRVFDLAVLKFGKDIGIVFLPGEIFTEIGLAIKKASPFRKTFVATLANGECGYVPLKECFSRGGYEILPVVGGGPHENTADLLIAEAGKLLKP